ncbi:MAG: tetratricopeptide repeat protein [candidate division KSB1 bacterium]|nr:tetratricopeptide repeat protein [candidate division KSB1 bacterium]
MKKKSIAKRIFLNGLLLAGLLLTQACGGSQGLLEKDRPVQSLPTQKEPNPRAVDLVIRGALEELMGNYQAALLAYQEAQLYDSTSVGLYVAIATAYQRLHKIESAIKVLNQALVIEPDNRDALETLAILHEFRRDYDAALRIYERLARLSPYDPELRGRLATLYAQKGETQKAIQEFQRLMELGQAGPEVWRPLGRLYIQAKRYDDAIRTLKNWVESDPYNQEPYVEIGLIYKVKKDTTALIEWYRQTLKDHPDFQYIREEMTNLLVDLGQIDDAIAMFEQRVAADSSDLVQISQLGNLYLQKGDTLKARKLFEWLVKRHPDDWRVYYNLGKLSYDGQKWQETAKFLQKAADKNPNVPQIWIMLGQAFWRMDSLEQANAMLDRVWQLNTSNPQVWLMLGQTYFQMQQLDRAERAAVRAHRLAPEMFITNYLLGLILNQQHRTEDAIPYFEMALRIDSTDVNAMGILAAIYNDLGQYARSDSLYERALRLAPDDPILQNNFSYGLAVRGIRLQEALDLVNRALQKQPDNPAFLDTKGWVLYQMGRYREALEYIQKSLDIRDTSAEVWEHLGDVYEKLGQVQEAVEAWQKAYDLDNKREAVLKKLNLYKN